MIIIKWYLHSFIDSSIIEGGCYSWFVLMLAKCIPFKKTGVLIYALRTWLESWFAILVRLLLEVAIYLYYSVRPLKMVSFYYFRVFTKNSPISKNRKFLSHTYPLFSILYLFFLRISLDLFFLLCSYFTNFLLKHCPQMKLFLWMIRIYDK